MEFAGLTVVPHCAPVRDLRSGTLAAVDVQLRGEEGGPLATSAALRTVARSISEQVQLDALTASVADHLEAQSVPLMVSVDVGSLSELRADSGAADKHEVVIITDHALITDPSNVLHLIATARAEGKVIAVDDVGKVGRSLALLPLIEPEVVILAAELLSRRPDSHVSRVAHAIAAHAELTGAAVIAHGVDSDEQLERALALGADYGVGEHFPSLEPLATLFEERCVPIPFGTAPVREGRLPFDIAAEGRRIHRSRKRLLVEMSTTLERHAEVAGPDTILLGTFQHAHNFTSGTRDRWESIAARVAYAGVYGVGMGPFVDGNVHHAPLDPAEPLVDEWNVVVLAPHFCAVLSAKDIHRGDHDADREFDYVVSYERSTAVRCARAILDRFAEAPGNS
ncbi:EAL domain-containing protein [Hoyosella rhizosphaerae]|uniref:EAL domain-containing protein n=1 Tax=Hoyosella rhizosphaerae TaxID=1755582 RepID=A0A916U7L8_9ACTN|nr:EAL domain-containing protein [Hoyosella rhizosphaerae]MBN4927551.1 EAL domain-containing protein [Hoyosella rhizosphaerae]GGC63583.1 hypothetical protein GCM10011410_15040 [Hoyosella rhizosphaerae]